MTVFFHDLGLIDYKQAWDYQEKLFNEIVEIKMLNRKAPLIEQKPTPNYLLFCEHPHVFTLGKSGDENNLLANQNQLEKQQATFYKINRGGDITYHGPGQIVGYPIFDLDNFFTDIHKYLRFLEEAIILTLADYGLKGGRIKGMTGVWLDYENPLRARKICAMGVRCSRWVTMHGFAFNINTNLSYFNHIIPCGISDKTVTSLSFELQKEVELHDVKEIVKQHLSSLFNMEYLSMNHENSLNS
jgi:lipoyl(octanoyl) transferase